MELQIDCGFNVNDETINFGSRKIADNDRHESVTFATVKTNTDSLSIPSIISRLHDSQLFCCFDNIVIVFHEEEFSSVKFTYTVNQIIDDFFYCSTSKLLLLFLRDGSTQIFRDDLETFTFISSVEILEVRKPMNDQLFVDIHFLHYADKNINLLAVTSIGQIMRLNIQISNNSEITVGHELIKDIEGSINISTYYNSLLLIHGSEMWMIDLLTENIISSNALDLKFVKFAGTMILSLMNSGQLAYICPVTLLHYIKDSDYLLDSIVIINDDREQIKYINAVSKRDSTGNVHFYLFRPDFSIVYTLTNTYDIVLISSNTQIDEARYISWLKKGSMGELRFQCVIETDPQNRLKRLLRRNMFDEAEKFARNQKLDVNIVSREKAKIIAENWKVTKKDIDTLIKIFDKLEDHSFILDCCLMIENTCENLEDLSRVLQYACELQISKKNETAKEKQYHCNRLLVKLNLFLIMKESELDRWNYFDDECLIREVKKLFKRQRVFQALTIYHHLSRTEIEDMNIGNVQEMLEILNEMELCVIEPILPRFISTTLEWLPTSLSSFIDWFEMKIFQMEKLQSDNFPENAIEFLEFNNHYLKLKNSHHNLLKDEEDDSCKKIKTLCHILNNLNILKSQYGVKIPINEMKQEPKIVVGILLNLDLSKDMYNSILQEFTQRYILENDLNPDQIFYDALIDILKYQESYWSTIIGSILSCITSQDLKLEAVENMFTRAKLPWSDIVRKIGVQILNECYPNSGNVQQLMADEPRMIVMSRSEYNFCINTSSNIDDLQFLVKRIIKCNLPTMISDAFILCEDKESYKVEAMSLLLHHFIENGDFSNIFEILEENKSIVKKGLERILVDVNLKCRMLTPSEAENYALFFNSQKIIEKYRSLCDNEFDMYKWKKKSNAFLAAHKIKTNFHINATSMSISQLKEKKNLVNEIRSKILKDYEDGKENIIAVLKSLKMLSSNLEIRIEKLYSQCWNELKVYKHEFLCTVAEEFLIQPVKVKYICILVVYLLKNLINEDETFFTENSFMASSSEEVSDKYSSKFLSLASLLISKAILVAETDELSACLKIIPWVDCIYFLNRYKEQNKTFSFILKKINPSFSCLSAMQKIFSIYISYIAQFQDISYKYLTYYNCNEKSITQEALLNQIKEFETCLYALNLEGESLFAYKLMTTLQTSLSSHEDCDHKITDTIKNVIKNNLTSSLIQQSILEADIDKNIFHTSLMWCNPDEIEKFITHTLQHNRKVLQKVTTISKIAAEMFSYHNNIGLSLYFKDVLKNVSWWKRLEPINMEYDLFFSITHEERLKLIIKSKKLNVKLIKEYCGEYNIADVQSFYLLQLKTNLLNWKPSYEIKASNIGRRRIIIDKNQQRQLFQECCDICNCIDNKEKVEKMLQEIWSQVNFYYYEVFECILDLYKDKSFKHLKLMLGFLETYQRINKPSKMEVEKWFNTFQDSQVIEPLSEFRILFNNALLESKNIWNIICKEISLENYSKWFEAVQAFNYLNVDNICSYLVKELIAEGTLSFIKPGDWVVSKHAHLFNEIDNCLEYMKDDVKKITVAYQLFSNTPEGADQVIIAKIVYKYAMNYKMRTSDQSKVSIPKIEKKYQKCLSLQILHKYNLAEQRYINLIPQIENLLLALVHDERIIKKMNNICYYCPDINTAIEKLAEVFSFNLVKFKEKLIEIFLMDSNNWFDLGGDITEHNLMQMKLKERTEKERSLNNIKRAAYICSNNIYLWHAYLWQKGYKSDKSDFYKARCVKCMLIFIEPIPIRALCAQSYDSILEILDQLTISSLISKFGLQINLHDTNTWRVVTKKLALIGTEESVHSLAQVCKILKIKKLKYWEYIIRNMDKYEMYWDMIEFLEYTKTEDYIYEKFYIDAWKNLINFIVKEIIESSDTERTHMISNDLIIVQQCPVLLLLPLEKTIEKCIELKCTSVAEVLKKYIAK